MLLLTCCCRFTLILCILIIRDGWLSVLDFFFFPGRNGKPDPVRSRGVGGVVTRVEQKVIKNYAERLKDAKVKK